MNKHIQKKQKSTINSLWTNPWFTVAQNFARVEKYPHLKRNKKKKKKKKGRKTVISNIDPFLGSMFQSTYMNRRVHIGTSCLKSSLFIPLSS